MPRLYSSACLAFCQALVQREERRREARKLKISEQVGEVLPSATPQQAAECVNALPQQSLAI